MISGDKPVKKRSSRSLAGRFYQRKGGSKRERLCVPAPTAISCPAYVDVNMVRADVAQHPADWAHGGYRVIQAPPKRYAVINLTELRALCGFARISELQQAHCDWVSAALAEGVRARDERWSGALAVGSREFVDRVKSELGMKALHRGIIDTDGTHTVREPGSCYRLDFERGKWRAKAEKHRFHER